MSLSTCIVRKGIMQSVLNSIFNECALKEGESAHLECMSKFSMVDEYNTKLWKISSKVVSLF